MNRREFIRNGVAVLLTTQAGLGMLRSVDEPFRMTATEVNRSMREHWDRVCNPPLVFDEREHLIRDICDRLAKITGRYMDLSDGAMQLSANGVNVSDGKWLPIKA